MWGRICALVVACGCSGVVLGAVPAGALASGISPVEGQAWSGTVGTVAVDCPEREVKTMTVAICSLLPKTESSSINWGDGTAASTGSAPQDTCTVDSDGMGDTFGSCTYTVTGTHAYAEEGSYSISYSAGDSSGSTTATVSDAALTYTVPAQPVSTVAGVAETLTVGTLTDADPGGTPGDYTVTIDWGDGSSSHGSVTPAAGGGFSVQGTHSYASDSNYALSVTVTDAGGASVVVKTEPQPHVNVVDHVVGAGAPVPVAAGEGTALVNAVVARFTDKDSGALPSQYAAPTIDWGDHTSSPGTIAAAPGGGFEVLGSHVYGEEGVYTITVPVTPLAGTGATLTSVATIADAPLTVSPGAALSTVEGASTAPLAVARFTDADPGAALSDYTATVDWGDGTAAGAGTIAALPGGGFSVTAAHRYAAAGTYQVRTTIVDAGGVSQTATTTMTVSDAPLTALAAPAASYTAGAASGVQAVAAFSDADPGATPGTFSATVDWGDGTPAIAGTLARSGSGFTVAAAHAYRKEGSYTQTVTITDSGGARVVSTRTVNVADAPLTVQARGLGGVAGKAVSGPVASFIDADPAGPSSQFTATINWGDGTTTPGTIVHGSAGYTVDGSHVYSRAGTYTASVTVSDPGGSRSTATENVTMAAPPTVGSSMVWGFRYTQRYTTVAQLLVQRAPASGQVTVTCHGHGCPGRHAITTTRAGTGERRRAGRTVDLASLFRGHRLAPGSVITVQISAPGASAKQYTFTTRPGRAPRVAIGCLAPGSRTASACR